MMSEIEIDIGRGDADLVQRPPQRRKIALGDMRQREILLVADADFAKAVAIREIGDGIHLPRRGVAGRLAFRLERERHDGVARELVVGDRVVQPEAEALVLGAGFPQLGRIVVQQFIVRIAKPRGDLGDHGGIERQRAVLDRLPFLFHLAGEFFRAELMHEDLDARLVDIVAPAVLIVGAQDRLDVAEQIALRQERLDGLADERRAPEPAPDDHLEAGLAGAIPVQPQRRYREHVPRRGRAPRRSARS